MSRAHDDSSSDESAIQTTNGSRADSYSHDLQLHRDQREIEYLKTKIPKFASNFITTCYTRGLIPKRRAYIDALSLATSLDIPPSKRRSRAATVATAPAGTTDVLELTQHHSLEQ